MDQAYYLDIFKRAAGQLDKKLLRQQQMEIATGIYIESVFLKLYKLSWTNKTSDPLTSPSRIFFSVWVSDTSLEEEKLMYNIHALKLRKLEGYAIESRKFAEAFRKEFKPFEKKWPDVRTDFGPLTLMEGWVKLNTDSLQEDVLQLSNQFMAIDYLIDDLLAASKL